MVDESTNTQNTIRSNKTTYAFILEKKKKKFKFDAWWCFQEIQFHAWWGCTEI